MAQTRADADFLTVHALTTPDKLAAVDHRPDGSVQTLSFAELEVRANRLAHALPGRGGAWTGWPALSSRGALLGAWRRSAGVSSAGGAKGTDAEGG